MWRLVVEPCGGRGRWVDGRQGGGVRQAITMVAADEAKLSDIDRWMGGHLEQ